METTGAGAAKRHWARQYICIDDVASKFSNEETICSPQFFCRDDPHPVLFQVWLQCGYEKRNQLSGFLKSFNRSITLTSVTFSVLDDLKEWKVIGGVTTGAGFSEEHCLGSTVRGALFGWESLHAYSASESNVKWHVIVEIEYERASFNPSPTFHEDFSKLLKNERHADVTFSVRGNLVKAHKFVLEARCPYFERMFQSNTEGSLANPIEIADVSPDVFDNLLEFIYSGQPPKFSGDVTMDLLSTAVKYGLESLKSTCEIILCANLSTENVIEALLLAAKHDLSDLKAHAMVFAKAQGANLEKARWNQLELHPNLLVELLASAHD